MSCWNACDFESDSTILGNDAFAIRDLVWTWWEAVIFLRFGASLDDCSNAMRAWLALPTSRMEPRTGLRYGVVVRFAVPSSTP